jgi:hypothetical protein
MKSNEFKAMYDYAMKTIIVEDDYLTHAGYLWLNLTQKQHDKMYGLLLSQGAKEETNEKGIKYIKLGAGGLNLIK